MSTPYQFGSTDPHKLLLFEQLDFQFHDANRHRFAGPFSTGPRQLPNFVLALFEGPWWLRLEGQSPMALRNGGVLLGSQLRHEIYTPAGQSFQSTWMHGVFTLFGGIDLLTGRFLLLEEESSLRVDLDALCVGAAVAMEQRSGAPGQAGGSGPEGPGAQGKMLAEVARTRALGFEMLARLSAPLGLEADLERRFARAGRLIPVLEYVAAHLAQPLRRDDLAELVHLSPTHFHTVFQETVGATPLAYVNSQRMMVARKLLVSTDLPVKAVAARCSPFDVFHFSRVFRAAHGMAPAQYRRLHAGGRL